ncbi:MAG: M28 family peptidase [Flavobacteriales bacterium]|nr:M28 family peptidase [Flavobacteriales bacterium]
MPNRPERTIRFVLFMGEEQGLLGSRVLVEHYRETGELARVKCMINLDMSGNPQGFGVGGPDGWAGLLRSACDSIRTVDTAAFAGRPERRSVAAQRPPALPHGRRPGDLPAQRPRQACLRLLPQQLRRYPPG